MFRWREAYRQAGRSGLKAKPITGRPPKLVARDLDRLVELLRQGPRAHGYRADLWTTARIAKLIRRQFAVNYHRDHIGRLMASLNWAYVKPGEEALRESTKSKPGIAREDSAASRLTQGWVPLCRGSIGTGSSLQA